MSDDLLNAFDECLAALAAGETPAACLARYPQWAADLRPMLEAAQAAVLPPSAATLKTMRTAQNAQRAAFLARAAQLRAVERAARPQTFSAFFALTRRALAPVLAVLVFIGLSSYGAARVSADSLPGDAFYGIKRTVEQAELFFTFNPQTRVELEENLTQRRATEVHLVVADGRAVNLEFSGSVTQMDGSRWVVADIPVLIASTARVKGEPFVGGWVEITGQSQLDGTVLATRVEVTGEDIVGIVRAIGPEVWAIDTFTVLVTSRTEIEGKPQVGDEVEVHVRPLSTGQLLALEIELTETHHPTATPETAPPTEAPPFTATPQPSATAAPSATPEAETEIEFSGVVETIGATAWQISGQAVWVNSQTEIQDDLRVGSTVQVKARRATNGELTALSIKRKSGENHPTATPRPWASQTPEPSRTAEPGHTAEATHPPEATQTPKPKSTDDDEGEHHPTATATFSVTSTPESTEFEGRVNSINNGEWVVGERTVMVTGDTSMEGQPQVGDRVSVRAVRDADGHWIATRIRKK